jgi:PAS domain-containing protein
MFVIARIFIVIAICLSVAAFFFASDEASLRIIAGILFALLLVVLVLSILDLNKRKMLIQDARAEVFSLGEARLMDFAESVADRFWETDEKHRYTYVSKRPEDSYLADSNSMIGKARWELDGIEEQGDFGVNTLRLWIGSKIFGTSNIRAEMNVVD